MKQLFSIILSTVIFFGSFLPKSDLEELCKIPLLVEHYQEHLQQDKISFTEFLKLHYEANSTHKEQESDDCNLPMHHHVCTAFAFVLPEIGFDITFNSWQLRETASVSYQNNYSFLTENFIFQPPKNEV